MKRPGFTLLEAMVAMVILALTVATALALLADTARFTARTEEWGRAVTLAEDGMDVALADAVPPVGIWIDSAGEGFVRRIEQTEAGRAGLIRVDVTVTWPDNGRFVLSRLVRAP